MSPFQQRGLTFSLQSLRDFEDFDFIDGLMNIFLEAPSALRPILYGRAEPVSVQIRSESKEDLIEVLANRSGQPNEGYPKSGVLLLEFAPNCGYMINWKKDKKAFQLVSGHASEAKLRTIPGLVDDYIDFIFQLSNFVLPEYGSLNSMMTVGWHLPYDLTKRLPNLPWMAIFGKPYIDMFGRENILRAPFAKVDELSSGLIAGRLTSTPFEPLSEGVREAVREYFGRDYFMEGTKSLKLYSGGLAPNFSFRS